MKKAVDQACGGVCCRMLLALLLLPGVGAALGADAEGPSAGDTADCTLQIEGTLIESLTLVTRSGDPQTFERPGASVSVPAGEYRVQEVTLQGDYASYDYSADPGDWFSLTPEEPHRLQVGAPLKPELSATRSGRIVKLDHGLYDGGGRRYTYRGENERPDPPRFTVYRGEQEVGSGAFEYG